MAGRSTRAIFLGMAATLAVVGAGCETDDTTAPTGCAGLVQAAHDAVEIDEQIVLLDRALTVCRSFDDFAAEIDRVPGLVGYATRDFVKLRCDERSAADRANTPACAAVPPPNTTIATTTTIADRVYVGLTLDGRQVEISASDGIAFVGERPEEVRRNNSIAAEAGCDGILERRAFWTARSGDPQLTAEERDVASVFARHAWSVATFIQCDVEPLPTDPNAATTATSTVPTGDEA